MNNNLLVSKDISIKCVIIGDSNTGKTSLIIRYINNVFNSYDDAPTIGSSFFHKRFERNGKSFRCDIWDTAGAERYRSLMPMYYRKADMVFICVDLTSINVMKQIEYWFFELNKFINETNPIIILVGTKSDLQSDNVYNPIIKNINIKYPGYMFFDTSAKINYNVSRLFNISFDLVINKKIKLLENNINDNSFEIMNINQDDNSLLLKNCFPNHCQIT